MLQSGFPINAWDHAVPYASLALSISKAAPILPWEKETGGRILDAYKQKSKQTCWECHHDNKAFEGPIEPFGRLCYYLEKANHTLAEKTVPGLFVGWRLESGMRFRNVLKVINYENARKGNFQQRSVIHLPTKEVYFRQKFGTPLRKQGGLPSRR